MVPANLVYGGNKPRIQVFRAVFPELQVRPHSKGEAYFLRFAAFHFNLISLKELITEWSSKLLKVWFAVMFSCSLLNSTLELQNPHDLGAQFHWRADPITKESFVELKPVSAIHPGQGQGLRGIKLDELSQCALVSFNPPLSTASISSQCLCGIIGLGQHPLHARIFLTLEDGALR